jgi:hypothetical protein
LFEAFVIGRDIDAKDDIVYFNFSSLWHLLNVLRNIAAGWLLHVNWDASYKKCRNTVALFSIGVNSLGHVNNPVCFAIIPETESAEICAGTYNAVKDAVLILE